MAIEVFNRYEHKYKLTGEQFERITEVIERHMEPDAYNKNRKPYTIANIYYDTREDYLIRKSLTKPAYKEKLRLRSYGVPDMESKVFLEIKKKYKGIVNKRRTTLTLAEAYEFTRTGIIPEYRDYMNKQVLAELAYFLQRYSLEPKLYLAYDRLAYFEKGNPDLRISFDVNIRSRRYDVALEKGSYGDRLLEEDIYLMEIKTASAKPLWLTEALSELELRHTSFSKYGTEFRRLVNGGSGNIRRISLDRSMESLLSRSAV